MLGAGQWRLDPDGTDRWWWDGKPTAITRTWKVGTK